MSLVHRVAFLTVMALSMAAASSGAWAAELLMFEDKGCPYCRRWDAEIGPGFGKTAEGQMAPLRRVMLREALPPGITLIRPVTVTPTFVLIDEGKEIGRLAGYAGAEFFYDLLGEILTKLPKSAIAAGQGAGQKEAPGSKGRPANDSAARD